MLTAAQIHLLSQGILIFSRNKAISQSSRFGWRNIMRKFVLAAIAALALFGVATRASADGFEVRRHIHHVFVPPPHVWGNGLWDIVRWSNGDCKVWHDDDGPPWDGGWTLVRYNILTLDGALARLHVLQDRGICTY
jgi:hypothetical protein